MIKKNLTLSAIPTLHSENKRFSLSSDSYFAQNLCYVYISSKKMETKHHLV